VIPLSSVHYPVFTATKENQMPIRRAAAEKLARDILEASAGVTGFDVSNLIPIAANMIEASVKVDELSQQIEAIEAEKAAKVPA